MANLKLNNDEVGWIKCSLKKMARAFGAALAKQLPITKKEKKMLWDLVDKIEKQEKKQIIKK